MRYLRNSSTDAHYNMAFDEFCLERLELAEPLFYLWQNAPAVIIGQNQNAYAEVNLPFLEAKGIMLARRMTGGGAVYHDLQNLNYSIVGRADDLERNFPDYLTLVIDALKQLGVPAALSGRNDILVEGRKVSGYAKRGWRDRIMIHGTLMYDVDIDTLSRVLKVSAEKMEVHGVASVKSRVANLKDYLPGLSSVKALQAALEEILSRGHQDEEVILSDVQLACIREMTRTKFATWDWNYGRSPHADIQRKKRFACGTIEAALSIEHGVLTDLAFSGDFLGNRSVDSLIPKLKGARLTAACLAEALQGEAVSAWFDGLSEEAFIGLLIGG